MSAFELYDWTMGDGASTVAIITHDEATDTWHTFMMPGLGPGGYPALLDMAARDGASELDDERTRRFLTELVAPPDRQGIDWLLREGGLTEWTLEGMLRLTCGPCADSRFALREVSCGRAWNPQSCDRAPVAHDERRTVRSRLPTLPANLSRTQLSLGPGHMGWDFLTPLMTCRDC